MNSRSTTRAGLALTLAFVAACLLPFIDAMVKLLVVDYSVIMVAWARMAGTSLLLGITGGVQVGTAVFQPKMAKLQCLRGLAAVLGTSMAFLGFRSMPLPECLAIILIAPIIASLFSTWWLGEKGDRMSWFAALLSFIGVLIIVRPGSGVFSFGAAYAVLSALGLASYLALTRALVNKDHSTVTAFFGPFVAFLIFSLGMPFAWRTPERTSDVLMFIAIGVLAALANLLQTYSYRYGTTHQIAPVSYSSVVISIGVAWLIFRTVPDFWSIAGILVVVCAGLITVLRR